jgi:hypothetical protein
VDSTLSVIWITFDSGESWTNTLGHVPGESNVASVIIMSAGIPDDAAVGLCEVS